MTPELIASALVSALTFAGRTGATEAVKKVAADGYESLKTLLHQSFGAESKPARALAELEEDPTSAGSRLVLTERLAKVDAAGVPEIVSSAQALLELLRALPSGEQHVQMVVGNMNAVADHGSTATVNLYGPPPPK